jgi:hypothetical protein
MSFDQLYYPNIEPKLNSKMAMSFLHWDRVLRIFPKKGSTKFNPINGIVKVLEDERILVSIPLEDNDIDKASTILDKIISKIKGPLSQDKIEFETLIRPVPYNLGKKGYFIYEGKTDFSFSKVYPKYFREEKDWQGNRVYLCSYETGLTYMTLLAYFVCKRLDCKNTITDSGNSFPLFVALNKYLNFPKYDCDINFLKIEKASKEVERIFYLPLLKLLEPIDFQTNKTIEKIIEFRRDYNDLRCQYLQIIEAFLNELYGCIDDEAAKETIQIHEQKFIAHLTIMISACKDKGIPVNERIVAYGNMGSLEIVAKLWDHASKFIELITLNYLSLLKPILKIKPSIDFYNNALKKSEHFYPLLIQEKFAPQLLQKIFRKIKSMDEIII